MRRLAETGAYPQLLQHDELNAIRRGGLAFHGFLEGPITFKPTYKYDIGSDAFVSSEKQRPPAWCDRVLWRVRAGLRDGVAATAAAPEAEASRSVRLLRYSSILEFRSSDHKPVTALFRARLPAIDPVRFAAVRRKVVRELDHMENDCLPDVALNASAFDFGIVRYLHAQTRLLTISNTGRVLVQFRFIPKPDETHVSRPWLRIVPPAGIIAVGESVSVQLMVRVDRRTAADLNTDPRLDDIVILHLDRGKDKFVSVVGTFRPTCFCRTIDALLGMHACTAAAAGAAASAAAQTHAPPQQALFVPKELWRLVDYIAAYGVDQPEHFTRSVDAAAQQQVVDALDTGSALPAPTSSSSKTAVAATLVEFLEALVEPVIPRALHRRAMDGAHSAALCRSVRRGAGSSTALRLLTARVCVARSCSRSSRNRTITCSSTLWLSFAKCSFAGRIVQRIWTIWPPSSGRL